MNKLETFEKESDLDRAFYISITLKAAHSALEIIGGILTLIISPATINHVVSTLTRHELSEDPHDFIATHVLKVAHDLTNNSARYFAAFYLLSHGIVKLAIIIALFKQKLWAYPWMIGVLGVFVVYQVYRIALKFSLGFLLLTIFDLFIMWLTWLEYKKHRRRVATSGQSVRKNH